MVLRRIEVNIPLVSDLGLPVIVEELAMTKRGLIIFVGATGTARLNLIREDKVAQMYSAIQTSSAVGMTTLDQCLQEMVEKRVITREIAREKAKIPENF